MASRRRRSASNLGSLGNLGALGIPIFALCLISLSVFLFWHHSSLHPDSNAAKEALGRGAWTLIHTTAAKYPQVPTETQQEHAKNFFNSIGALYPCLDCRIHFYQFINSKPPDVSSRDKLLLWTCAAHNEVNKRNEKAIYPCVIKTLNKRWGDCGCGGNKEKAN